jgi:AraC-like DNA-binding protein
MQLHRKTKALLDHSPGELIRAFRMRKAADLIIKNYGSVTTIAYEVGYNNPSAFSESFQHHFGVYPSEYLKRYTNSKS